MTGQQFYYYLTNADGEYYYVDTATGEVKTTEIETAIKETPSGWGEQGIKFGRDEQLWGIFNAITTALKFRGDGKKIIEHVFYQNDKYPYNDAVNFEAYCGLKITKRIDGAENTWNYETWFNGKFDFSEVIQNEDKEGNFIQVQVLESSLKQIFDANRDTEYEIPITSIPEEETILMDGVVLDNDFNWATGQIGAVSMVTGSGYVFPMGLQQIDSTNYFRDLIYFQEQGLEVSSLSFAPNDMNSFLYTTEQFSGDITLSMNFNWSSSAGTDIGVVLLRKNMTNNSVSVVHTFYSSGPVGGTLQNATFTATHTETFLPYDYRYFISIVPNITATYAVDVLSASMKITFSQALPATDCKAISYQNYAKLLVAKAFEGQSTMVSKYLSYDYGDLLYKFYDLYPKRLYITCGDALRQLPDPVIKGSLSNLIKDVYSRYMCGVGLDGNVFFIETLEYFLQKNVKIGTVKNTTKPVARPAKNLLFNDIKVGYPEFRADDLNGRSEWNSTQDYKMGFKTITDDKDLTTPYKASVYEIEYLRSEVFSSGNTKDNRNDNSIYLLYCSDAVVDNKRQLQKYTTGQIAGIPNPTSQYNIALSPKRNLLRHIPYLKSIMNIPDNLLESGYKVEFIGGDRNTDLETRINGSALWTIEYDAVYPSVVPLNNALPRLFKPLTVQFEAYPQPELLQFLRTRPYGYLEVLNGDNTFGIFVTDVEISGADLSPCKFTGLLHPDSDTKQFIS